MDVNKVNILVRTDSGEVHRNFDYASLNHISNEELGALLKDMLAALSYDRLPF